MRSALRIAGQALVALTFLAACGSSPSTVAKATPPSSPASASILDDHFGFLAGDGVRSESDARPLFVLGIGEVSGVVSPDGSRLAYWAANELRVTLKENIAVGSNARFEAGEGNALESYLHVQNGRGVNGVLVEVARPSGGERTGRPGGSRE